MEGILPTSIDTTCAINWVAKNTTGTAHKTAITHINEPVLLCIPSSRSARSPLRPEALRKTVTLSLGGRYALASHTLPLKNLCYIGHVWKSPMGAIFKSQTKV